MSAKPRMGLTVLADSRAALEHAFGQGLPRDAVVRTASPSLALAADLNVRRLEERITGAEILALSGTTLDLAIALRQALIDAALPDYAHLAALGTASLQRVVLKAMALGFEALAGPVAVVLIECDPPARMKRLNSPWESLLRANPQLQLYRVPIEGIQVPRPEPAPRKTWRERLRPERLCYYRWRWWRLVSDTLRVAGGQGSILFHSRMSNMLMEVGSELARGGYSLRLLGADPVDRRPVTHGERIREALTGLLVGHLESRVPEPSIEPLIDLYLAELEDGIEVFDANLPMWRARLAAFAAQRPAAVFVGYPTLPGVMALGKACREVGVPLVSAQHGVGREINEVHRSTLFTYENNVADLVLTYNETAARLSNEDNPFRIGTCVSVGAPSANLKTMARAGGKPPHGPPILFVSTILYSGNVQMITAGGPDHERAAYTIGLINDVFEKLPCRVLFKTYPTPLPRYLDPDPIVDVLREATNVDVFEGETEVREMVRNHRVVVTTIATSTLGWCLSSDAPLVFIDHPYMGPLKSSVREAFGRACFLFDASDGDLHQQLRTFLSRSFDDIDAEWEAKRLDRQTFVEHYMISGGLGAEKRGAELLRARFGGGAASRS